MQNYILDYSKSGKQPNIRELTLLNGISYPDDEELIMLILGKGTNPHFNKFWYFCISNSAP